MTNLWMSLALLCSIAGLYFFAGLLIPGLPLVRTRGRAAKFLGLSIVGLLVFAIAGSVSMTPEQKEELAQQRIEREREAAENERKRVAERAEAENERKRAAAAEEAKAGPSRLIAAIRDALGKPNRKGVAPPEVRLDETGTVFVKWAIDENLSENMTKRGAQLDVVNVLKAVKDAGLPFNSVELQGTFSMVDKFGNGSEIEVVTLTYQEATVKRINFDGFRSDNAYMIGDLKRIHPAFVP